MTFLSRFQASYNTLLIEPDAAWEEIRASYKKLAQAWHPDRFPEGSPDHNRAKQKFQEISHAFTHIESYVKTHGIPPLLDHLKESELFESASAQADSSSATSNASHSDSGQSLIPSQEHPSETHGIPPQQETYNEAGFHQQPSYNNERQKELLHLLYTYITLICFLLAMGFIYTTWIQKSSDEGSMEHNTHAQTNQEIIKPNLIEVTKEMTQVIAAEMNQLSKGDNKGQERDKPEQPLNLEHLPDIEFSDGNINTRHHASITSSYSQRKLYRSGGRFTYGDSVIDVINVHGPPHHTEKADGFEVWTYGKSTIHFEDGEVKEWVSHPDTPLSTSLQ